MLTKDTAICIRTVDYSETSQIVTFFTRANGKLGAIAKGSKRPKSAFDGPIEMFSFGEIVFSDPRKEKLATLTEFQQQTLSGQVKNFSCYGTLRRDEFTLNCCLFAAELVNNLTHDNDPHPGLFDGFLRFLQDINERREIPASAGTSLPLRRQGDERREALQLLILFQLTLLREIGLMPILNACANCKTRYEKRETRDERRGTNYEVYFSSSANGLICRDCQVSFHDGIKLTESAAACLINLKEIIQSQEQTLTQVEKILIFHFTELLGHRPKMAKYLWKIPQQNVESNGR